MSKPAPLNVTVSRHVAAPPEVLYDLVSDVTRMPTYSPETIAVSWIGSTQEATPGARFKGTNRLGTSKWSTKPIVTAAERGATFAFKVPGKSGALWTYAFEPSGGGTIVTETMRQERPSPFPIRFLQRRAGVTDRAAHLAEGMTVTLDRIAAAAEHAPAGH